MLWKRKFLERVKGATIYYFFFHFPANLNRLVGFMSQVEILNKVYIENDYGIEWNSE